MARIIKCGLCEAEFDEMNEDNQKDIESINESSKCVDCWEEFGDGWPDRN